MQRSRSEIPTEPLIKRHPVSVDISSEFFQLHQNPRIGDQRLTAKNPTMRTRQRWWIDESEASYWRAAETPTD
jgi:hypothetical protein